MLDKNKIQELSALKHPASSELENKEGLIKRIFWWLYIGWDGLIFLIACFASSLVADRAQYDGYYVSDYRMFIYNIFGAELPVDPAEDFFASPFVTFMFIITFGFLVSLVIVAIFNNMIANVQAKRLTLDETFQTKALIKHMAEEKIMEESKQENSTTN